MMKINKIRITPKWIMIIMIVIAIVMILSYLSVFHNGLSSDSSDWGAFGAYFGGVAGWLAFAGVLLTIKITSDQNTENSDRDYFFKMLELHSSKFSSVEYKKDVVDVKAAEAFKKYTETANLYLKHVIIYNYITKRIEEGKKINDLDNLFYNDYNYQRDDAPITNLIAGAKSSTEKALGITLIGLQGDKIVDKINEALEQNKVPLITGIGISHIVEIILKNNPLLIDDIYSYIKKAADAIYDEYGHILGHYFRNLYYVMKITNTFRSKNSESYKPLLRAQISRYEIAMNVYNALSSRSSVSMIEYLEDYKIFKDLYKTDLFLFELPKENKENLVSELLQKSQKHLESIKRM